MSLTTLMPGSHSWVTQSIPSFIATCGGPASGKSTHVSQLIEANPDWFVICPDQIRFQECGCEEDQSKDNFIWRTLIPTRIIGAWLQRKTTIFDATLVHRKARKQILGFAKKQGFHTILHVMNTPFNVCCDRNAVRSRVVPSFVLEQMKAKWQEPDLAIEPYIDEIVNIPFVP